MKTGAGTKQLPSLRRSLLLRAALSITVIYGLGGLALMDGCPPPGSH